MARSFKPMSEEKLQTLRDKTKAACSDGKLEGYIDTRKTVRLESYSYFFINSNIALPAAWPMRVYQMALPR